MTPDVVRQATAHWEMNTDRIRFVELNDQNRNRYQNWVRFVSSDGCSSRVGMKPTPGEQTINLAVPGCGVPQVIHEIGHAVGLWHEQSRNDRDQYLIILGQNIVPNQLFNFDIV